MEILNKLMIWTTFISGICTIVASFIAVITLTIWRKQQRYSPKLNAVMDLEDRHELLMIEYYKIFEKFYGYFKAAIESEDRDKEYRSEVTSKIKSDHSEFSSKSRLAECQINYQLQYARTSRLVDITNYETIKYKALCDFQANYLNSLSATSVKNSSLDDVLTQFAENFSSFKNESIREFKLIRDSI